MARLSMLKRRNSVESVLHALLFLILVVTVTINLIYLSKTSDDSLKLDHAHDHQFLNRESERGSSSSDVALSKLSRDKQQLAGQRFSDTLTITAKSGKELASLVVNGKEVYRSEASGRGIHIVVLHQSSGRITTVRTYDTFLWDHDEDVEDILDSVPQGRVVVFMTVDDASYRLRQQAREVISALGSKQINGFEFRDSWVFVAVKGKGRLSEKLFKSQGDGVWGEDCETVVEFRLIPDTHACKYGGGSEEQRRKEFCGKYDAYGKLCDCTNHEPVDFTPIPLEDNNIVNIPIVIIAANRPILLYKLLRKLLSLQGVDVKMVTVFIDNDNSDEMYSVCKVFNVRFVVHKPVCDRNCRIGQHYRQTLTETFDSNPNASAMIILEEDLDVSPDIMSYFSQTYPLLESDDSLFCVSAWNDQGYDHVVHDPAMLSRVSTMPGLGWILKRSIYKGELEEKWPGPSDYYDWDVWLRQDEFLKGRDCIIPEISRTFHRGIRGLNMDELFHELYFKHHALNNVTGVQFDVDRMRKENYVSGMHKLVSNAIVLDHNKNPCSHPDDFMPNTQGMTYVSYIKMEKSPEDEKAALSRLHKPKMHETWTSYARCMKIWDPSPRGLHNRAMRIWYNNNYLLIVGVPESPYSIHKPSDIQPVFIPEEKQEDAR